MRRRIAVILVAVMATMALATGASAVSGGPCDDIGAPGNSDYAQHHISVLAKAGNLGNPNSGAGHRPGTHSGFSICL